GVLCQLGSTGAVRAEMERWQPGFAPPGSAAARHAENANRPGRTLPRLAVQEEGGVIRPLPEQAAAPAPAPRRPRPARGPASAEPPRPAPVGPPGHPRPAGEPRRTARDRIPHQPEQPPALDDDGGVDCAVEPA